MDWINTDYWKTTIYLNSRFWKWSFYFIISILPFKMSFANKFFWIDKSKVSSQKLLSWIPIQRSLIFLSKRLEKSCLFRLARFSLFDSFFLKYLICAESWHNPAKSSLWGKNIATDFNIDFRFLRNWFWLGINFGFSFSIGFWFLHVNFGFKSWNTDLHIDFWILKNVFSFIEYLLFLQIWIIV